MSQPGSAVDLKRIGFVLSRLRAKHLRHIPLGLVVTAMQAGFGLFKRGHRETVCPSPLDWKRGVSIVVPERGGVDLLELCLRSLAVSMARIDEPAEVIVVINGSPLENYAHLKAAHPSVRWLHFEHALGFTRAVLQGIAVAQHGATYLLNNDMLLDPEALREAMNWRKPSVFAIASQIFFQDSSRRREETGWTSMPIEAALPRPRHETPESAHTRGTVWAGAGSALFHSETLRQLMPGSLPYDPFYWEDADLGIRGWRAGYDVLFCPGSIVWHRHRATVERFYELDEVERIFERNRLQYQLRNPFPLQSLEQTLWHIAQLDKRSVRELSTLAGLADLARARWRAFSSPSRDMDYENMWTKTYLSPSRPTIVVVTPFAILPPSHGGAVRTYRLAVELAKKFTVILLSDEKVLYGGKSTDNCAPFHIVRLIAGRGSEPEGQEANRVERIRSHSHAGMASALKQIIDVYSPVAVVVEHMELAGLVDVTVRRRPSFILSMHDVLLSPQDVTQREADAFETTLMRKFDGRVVCSSEDAALLGDCASRLVPNGADDAIAACYRPSHGLRSILFVGPFRVPINLRGICDFLADAYPQIEAAVPGVTITIVGGVGAKAIADTMAVFSRASINVVEHVGDIGSLIAASAITINPQRELRGSSLKVIESIAAGRVCVSTFAGARGWRDNNFRSLLLVDGDADFVAPIVKLLTEEAYRVELETPDVSKLSQCTWSAAGEKLTGYVSQLVERNVPSTYDHQAQLAEL